MEEITQPTFDGLEEFEYATQIQENATKKFIVEFFTRHDRTFEDGPIISSLIMNARLIDILTHKGRDTSRQFTAYGEYLDRLYSLHPYNAMDDDNNPLASLLKDAHA